MASSRNTEQQQPIVPDFDEGHRNYTYTPLEGDQIRLLKLLRGQPHSELEASLEIHTLPDKEQEPISRPPYEAVSYCWGEKSKNPFNYSIKILQDSDSYLIFIRPNLESALRQLRLTKHHRYLWVDALCINQKVEDDLDEKNEKNVQIPRISLVYNKAKSVCVWLGRGDDTSDDAMAFVRDVLNLNTFDRFVESVEEVNSLANFAKLLRRPWFNRRWIVQELAVAREATLYCGSKAVSWGEFAGAVSLFSSKHMNLKKIFKESKQHGFDSDYLGDVRELGVYRLVHAASNFYRKSDAGDVLENLVSLEEVVSVLTAFDAKDPRDVIYSVLALSRDATASAKDKSAFTWTNEQVDEAYEKLASNPSSPVANSGHAMFQSSRRERRPSSDWRDRAIFERFTSRFRGKFHPDRIITIKYKSPVFDVYRDFLAHTVLHSKSIDIICRPWAADIEGLPSWIPKKSGAIFGFRSNRAYSRIRADLLVGTAGPKGKQYSASQDSTTEWYYRPHDALSKSLVVQGFVLDTIEQKLVPAMGGVIPAEWYKEWKKCQKTSKGSHTLHEDAFWRTLIADRGLEGQKPPPSYYKLACDYSFDNRVNQGYLDTREMMRDCPSIVEEYLQRVQAVTWMRRLVLSRKHQRLGLVPYETKKKDLVCILQGCSVPVILRRHDTAQWIEEQLRALPSENAAPTINVQGPETDDEAASQNDSFGGEGHGGVSATSFTDKDKAAAAEAEKRRIRMLRRAFNAALDVIRLRELYEAQKVVPSQGANSAPKDTQNNAQRQFSSPAPNGQDRNHAGNNQPQAGSTGPGTGQDPEDTSFNINNDRTPEASSSSGAAENLSQPNQANGRNSGSMPASSHPHAPASRQEHASEGDLGSSDRSQHPPNTIDSADSQVQSGHGDYVDNSNLLQPTAPSRDVNSQSQSHSDTGVAPVSSIPARDSGNLSPADHSRRPPPNNMSGGPPKNGNRAANRSLQTTSNKYTHIPEPQRLQKGDRISSWKDQTLPKYFYEFIGECYIHGMMDGEAMKYATGSFPEIEPFNPLQGTRQVFWLR